MPTIDPIELWSQLVEVWGGQTQPILHNPPFLAVSRLPLRLANGAEIGQILAVFLLEESSERLVTQLLEITDTKFREILRTAMGRTIAFGGTELVSMLGISMDDSPIPTWLNTLRIQHGARLMCYEKHELKNFACQHPAILENFFGTAQQALAQLKEKFLESEREIGKLKSELRLYEHEFKTVAGMERRLAQTQAWQDLLSTTQHKLSTKIGFLKGITDRHRASTSERWDTNVFDKLHHAVVELQDRLAILEGRTIQALERREHDISEIVQVLQSLTDTHLVKFIPRSSLHGAIEVDLKGLQDCVEQLIENANYWTKERSPEIALTILIRSLPFDMHMLEITCRDNGPGVEDGDKLSIFEPLMTGRPGGKGLGLHMVKRFCEIHKGEAYENGKFDQGANFVMRLPLKTRGNPNE